MGYDVSIERTGLRCVLDVKGVAAAAADRLKRAGLPMPKTPNSSAAAEGRRVCRVGPEHWLVVAPAGDEEALLGALAPGDPDPDCRVVHASDAYEFFAVTGADAMEIMAVASPLDTRPGAFAADGAGFAEFLGIKALVMREAEGFAVAVERSYGDMVAEYLARVAGR